MEESSKSNKCWKFEVTSTFNYSATQENMYWSNKRYGRVKRQQGATIRQNCLEVIHKHLCMHTEKKIKKNIIF